MLKISITGNLRSTAVSGSFGFAVGAPIVLPSSRHAENPTPPCIIASYNTVVESEFHPNTSDHTNTSDRSLRPYLLTDTNIKFVGDPPLGFPVFIPTIPQFPDSCLDVIRAMKAIGSSSSFPQMEMDSLAWYLALDLRCQQDKLLPHVMNSAQLAEYFCEATADPRRKDQDI